MNRILLFTLTLLSFKSSAQYAESNAKTGSKSQSEYIISNFEADLITYDDVKHFIGTDKKQYWVFLKKSSLGTKPNTYFTVTDSNFQVTFTKLHEGQSFGIIDKNPDFVIESDTNIAYFYKDKLEKKHIVTSFSVNKKTGEFSQANALSIPPKEEYICGLSDKNRYVVVTRSNKADSLYVYEFFADKPSVKHGINCVEHGILKFKEMFKDVAVIKNDDEKQLVDVVDKHKVYLMDNQIIFSRQNDDPIEMPYFDFLTIDITNWKSARSIKYIKFPENILKYYNVHSFLQDSFTFISWASSKSFNLTIYKTQPWEALKTYQFDNKGQISFKNSPIWKEETNNATFFSEKTTDVDEVESVKKFLKNVVSGKLGVAVNRKNQEYNLLIGVVNPVQFKSPAMPIGPIGGPVSITIGGKYADLLVYQFKSVLDAKTLEHNPTKQLPTISSFQQYTNGIEVDANTILLTKFMMDERNYMAYFDKKSNKYFILADK
jgi:hypothetical protein